MQTKCHGFLLRKSIRLIMLFYKRYTVKGVSMCLILHLYFVKIVTFTLNYIRDGISVVTSTRFITLTDMHCRSATIISLFLTSMSTLFFVRFAISPIFLSIAIRSPRSVYLLTPSTVNRSRFKIFSDCNQLDLETGCINYFISISDTIMWRFHQEITIPLTNAPSGGCIVMKWHPFTSPSQSQSHTINDAP